MMLGVDCDLHIVADDAGAAPARRHRAAVGISQRDLLVGRCKHRILVGFELLHLSCQPGELLLQMRRLRGERLGGLLQIGGVELRQIARHALLQLLTPPLDLAFREVLVARVDRLELRAVDRHARLRQQAHLPAQLHELCTNLLNCGTVVLAEVGDRLVVGREPLEKPDHLQIAARLAFEPAARLDAVEIAVDVELQQRRWVIAGRPVAAGSTSAKPSSVRSSSSTKTSTARTGLLSSTQSSRQSGSNVD